MSENIIGPHGVGVNETVTRPTDTSSGNITDTWFKDCVAGVAGTGTKIPAVWLNKVTAQIRRAIRGMSVPDSELDDDMLLKAIQNADRGVVNLGASGHELYAGFDVSGKHQLRKIKAGANVTLTQNVGGEVEIATSPPGGGGSLANVGDGADVYKGLNGTTHEFHGVKGVGGITTVVNADNVEVDGSALSPVPHFLIEERFASGVHAGSLSTNVRKERDMNTLVRNVIGGALVGPKRFALPAGTYFCEWNMSAYNIDQCRAFLRNVTDSTDLLVSVSGSYGATSAGIGLIGMGSFTLAATKTLALEVISSHPDVNTYALGRAGSLGPYELYSYLRAWKF